MERAFLSREMTGADHHWVIADPLCDVSGVIELFDASTGRPTVIEFNGRGYHDHNSGTGPLGPGLEAMVLGTHAHRRQRRTRSISPGQQTSICVMRFIWSKRTLKAFTRSRSIAWTPTGRGRRRFAWRIPSACAWTIVLSFATHASSIPRPFTCGSCMTRPAAVKMQPVALCEIAYPHRLRWPLLGRMIEMSIAK